MSLTLRATLLALVLSVSVHAAENRTLALYSGPVRGLDSESANAMRAELQRLLTTADIDLVWRKTADRKSTEVFDLVAVASFDGSCSRSEPVPPVSTVSLADTSITDGRVLPFLHVDCTRLIQMLGSQVEPAVFGRALARVIAHELYHIVSHTAEHQEKGIAKAVFSVNDLKNPRFEFDIWSLDRMRAPTATVASDSVSSELAASSGR